MTFRTLKDATLLGLVLVSAAACSSNGNITSPQMPDESTPGGESGQGASPTAGNESSPSAGPRAGNNSIRPGNMGGSNSSGSAGSTGSTGSTGTAGEDMMAGDPLPVMNTDPADPCWLKEPAFCDKFDNPSPGGRGGDIDDATWAVARVNLVNYTQNVINRWSTTTASGCGVKTDNVLPPNDFSICKRDGATSGQLNHSFDDHGGFVLQSKRIRQPFDFADRVGVISFDVDGRSQMPTGHGYWFNVFVSSEPVPAAYQDGGTIALFVKSGVGVEFQGSLTPCHDAEGKLNLASSVFVEKNYKIVKETNLSSSKGCFKTADEVLNHIEVRLTQDRLEVWASDAGKPETFRQVAAYDDLDLDFTRGYVHFSHTHYNANKPNSGCPDPTTNCPIQHGWNTYHWDNIGFDGPALPAPRSYELTDNTDGDATRVNLGYQLLTTGMKGRESFTLENVDLTGAKRAAILLNAWNWIDGSINYRFNGGEMRSFAHPFPEGDRDTRAVIIPIDLADLQAGTNTLELQSTSGEVIIGNGDLEIYVD